MNRSFNARTARPLSSSKGKANPSERSSWFRKEGLLRFLFGVMVTIAGMIAAYHATIYGLKTEIAAKADTTIVASIDNRLIRIEAILTERMATKTELREAQDDLNRTLITIQAKLQLLP